MKKLPWSVLILGVLLVAAGAERSPERRDAPLEGRGAALSFTAADEVDTLRPGAVLFTDRRYTVKECPPWLVGRSFLRGSIDWSGPLRVTEDGVLTVLTPEPGHARAATQHKALESRGFVWIAKPDRFQLFGAQPFDVVRIYQKQVTKGERLNLAKWGVIAGFSSATRSAAAGKPWSENRGERLYNGIVLPEEWPPQTIDPRDTAPMPVPYLASRPAVAPIDVGRQLFVDDFLIESSQLKRVFHMPKKYAGNPILKAETKLELNAGKNAAAVPKSGGVWWDPAQNVFKMWYEAGWINTICYATSKDGLAWQRPALDVKSGTNQVLPPDLTPDSWTVVPDWTARDPQQRYKLFMRPPGGQMPGVSMTSPDGVHWTNRTATGETGDRSTMFYNPFRKKWIYSLRSGYRGRSRHYWECDDFLAGARWRPDEPAVWAAVDRDDPKDPVIQRVPQLYNLDAVAYESLMLGFFEIHHGPENDVCEKLGLPKITELNFAYSRDGFHWHRPDRRAHIPAERRDVWDRGYVQSLGNLCCVRGDTLWFYYSGFQGDATKNNRPWLQNGMYDRGATGLAFLRRDGFASLEAGDQPGTMTTRPVTFTGSRVFVNAATPKGELRVEILDEAGEPIAPYTLANCRPIATDSTLEQVAWTGADDVAALRGRPVRFRFSLRQGALYAFWVSRDATGRSDGYVAGGGPGFTGMTDTVGRAALDAERRLGVKLVGQAANAESVLPEGAAPAPVVSRHFPDRVSTFLWRNWNAVEPAKLAAILHTSVENVQQLADSMGLPPADAVPAEMKTRGYITLLRRNWHLLPYEQLLELVEMTPERLAFSLREDDFLWVKLGRLKPKCEPLYYQAPDEAARRRAAEIRRVVAEDFGPELRRPLEPRFDFVRQLSQPLPELLSRRSTSEQASQLRLVHSYVALYGDPLSNDKLNPYPDGFLQRLSAVGINGVWLHAVLRDLAPGGPAFPEFGVDHQKRLANLRTLVARAKTYGVGVYLYMNEPRGMPHAFFAHRREMAGVKQGELTALCTSQPAVREWMESALTYVFREVPDLAGIYAISASENLTSCASLGAWRDCPRCRTRSDAEIIAEVVATLEKGVHRGNPKANVIVSDWGWRGHGDAREIIARLPKEVWLMSVSEWDLPIERGGVASKVGEYAISAVGPGPRATRHWATAAQAGIKTAAEIQFNNTCEIASLPYLPVMDLVAEHCRNLAPFKLDGMLVGWTMGGYPAPNFELARQMSRRPTPDMGAVLDGLARERFGQGAAHARKAWTLMSEAYRQYPFHISVVYASPVQCGPANPLYPSPTGYRATMWGIPYDDLNGWRGPYPPEVFAAQFAKVAEGWRPGVAELELAAANAPPQRRSEAQADVRLARAAAIHFQSVANQARFVLARDALAKPGAKSPEERRRLLADVKRLLESEIELARQLYTLVREDSRIGFEPSCQYFYLPLDLVEKVVACRWLLQQFAE